MGPFRRALAAVALLAAFAMPFASNSLVGGSRAAAATVATTTDYLNLRSGPGLENPVLRVIPVGATVSVAGDPENGFYPVAYGGTNGWASGDYLTFGGTSGSATTTDYLNLRAGPSLDEAVLTVMPPGSAVTLTGDASGDFVSVSYAGMDGWAARAYLDLDGDEGGGGAVGGSAIVVEDLNLRDGPSLGATVLLVMPAGVEVGLTGEREAGFAEVVYGGVRGWAFSTYLDDGDLGQVPPSAPPANPFGYAPPAPGSGTAIVTEDLNLRTAASTDADVRDVMPAGATVTLTGSFQGGYFLVLYGGERGWASSTYLLTGGRPADEYGYSVELIRGFIADAARRFGQDPDEMIRVADCESDLDPQAVNPAGSYGLFQFVRGTWESTPYADNDIFEAWANANAAAWMWANGRRHEWVC
jgi:uncharacterized protein YraI